jgi:hypothetical protein
MDAPKPPFAPRHDLLVADFLEDLGLPNPQHLPRFSGAAPKALEKWDMSHERVLHPKLAMCSRAARNKWLSSV